MTSRVRCGATALAAAAALALAGCGSSGPDLPMGPGPMGPGAMPAGTPTFLAVSPSGGASGVSATSAITFRWGVPMGSGMEEFVDLHQGDLSGSTVPISCAWSGDLTTLTCTPAAPLRPGTLHTVHLGGGMVDATGQPIDMTQYGPGFGGEWIMGTKMGGVHAGAPWGMMGSGWRHANGSYGMAFSFTTA